MASVSEHAAERKLSVIHKPELKFETEQQTTTNTVSQLGFLSKCSVCKYLGLIKKMLDSSAGVFNDYYDLIDIFVYNFNINYVFSSI